MLVAEVFGVDGIVVIVVIAIVLLFGGTALPKLARGLGSARKEFERGMKHGDVRDADTGAAPLPAASTSATVVEDL
jgi:sec-independent protein translocase protein TatA